MKHILLSLFIIFTFTIITNAAAIKVMPLGDSITYDDSYADQNHPRPASLRHAYRNYLYYKLRDARYWVDFVGSRVAGTAIVPHFDPENEGYPGESSNFIANNVYRFLVQSPTDIILLHIGTNDRWSLNSDGSYMRGMQKIFTEVDRYERNYHHHIKIILALIIGRKDNDFSSFTNNFNTHLRKLTNSRIAHGDDIYLVDMQHHAGLDYHNDFRDPAHPTTGGYNKIANVWYNALKRFLPAPRITPRVPSKLNISIRPNNVTLRWKDNANNEIGYKVYHGSKLVATLKANTTSYVLSNLAPNTTYAYKVVAFNTHGSSSAISFTFTSKDNYGWLPAIYHIILH